MVYNLSKSNSWYNLSDLNLSGTKATGTSLNVPTINTWTSVARIDNEDIDLDFVLYRSAIQEDGRLSNFKGCLGTSAIQMRILPPSSKTGLEILSGVSIGTDVTTIGIIQSEFTPSRSIPVGSLIQVKLTGVPLEEVTGTNNRLYLHMAFSHKGVSPQITDLTKY